MARRLRQFQVAQPVLINFRGRGNLSVTILGTRKSSLTFPWADFSLCFISPELGPLPSCKSISEGDLLGYILFIWEADHRDFPNKHMGNWYSHVDGRESWYSDLIFFFLKKTFVYLSVLDLLTWHADSRVCRLCSCGRRLSCPAARGILVPWPGLGPPSPALESRF